MTDERHDTSEETETGSAVTAGVGQANPAAGLTIFPPPPFFDCLKLKQTCFGS